MNVQWIGMVIVFAGCGGVGLRLAWQSKQRGKMLKSMAAVLLEMENELDYQMTPLPELCRRAALHAEAPLSAVLNELAEELSRQISPDASCCMQTALAEVQGIGEELKELLLTLGTSLGRFDLTGQLEGLRSLRRETERLLEEHRGGEAERVRSYQILGLCAGAALAILFV